MKKMSVAAAKAHFSEVVEDARRGKKIVILKHGKPVAAVIPLEAMEASVPKPPPMTEEEYLAFIERIASSGDPTFDAVADLVAGRDRYATALESASVVANRKAGGR